MNAEIKARWLEALRGGDYQQGKFMLQNGNGQFCCLGVLCDLYAKEKGIEWERIEISVADLSYQAAEELGEVETVPAYTLPGLVYVDGLPTVLPEEVIDWAGLDSPNPDLDDVWGGAASMNDADGLSFDEIAAAIERSL